MKHILATTAVVGLSLVAAFSVSAADVTQLAAGAGISAGEAQGLTLTELAALKFNRDSERDEQQSVAAAEGPVMVDPVRHAQLIAAAGLSADEADGLTLSQLAAGKHNAEARRDELHLVVMSSRGRVRAGSQLIAAAGLSTAEAQGMSLTGIAATKFNRDSGRDEAQTAGY
jgi:hypothetical protein